MEWSSGVLWKNTILVYSGNTGGEPEPILLFWQAWITIRDSVNSQVAYVFHGSEIWLLYAW